MGETTETKDVGLWFQFYMNNCILERLQRGDEKHEGVRISQYCLG